jgi:lysophospholipase L1-like esterase
MCQPGLSAPDRPKALSLGKKLLFSLATCLAVFCLAEMSCRLARGWNRNWLPSHCWHPQLGWCLRPGWSGKEVWTGGFSRINPQGIRDDRPVGRKARRERRMLIIGDSITFGAMVPTQQTFPYLLERFLADDNGWRVLNGGVTGYDPQQEFEWLELFGWQLEPDVIGVAFCRNDVCPSVRFQFAARDREPVGVAGRWLSEHFVLASYLQRAIWYLEARLGLATAAIKEVPANAPVDSPRPGWPFVEQAYRRIARSAREKNVSIVLFVYPTLGLLAGREPDDLTERLQELAKELNWSWIDLAPAFSEDPASLFIPGDPLHPNGNGYQRAAEYAAKKLNGLERLGQTALSLRASTFPE